MSDPEALDLSLRVPAAVIRLWLDDADELDRVLEAAGHRLLQHPGIYRVGPAAFAVAPVAGDPAPFDTALYWSRRILAARRAAGGGGATAILRLLISPAEVRTGPAGGELLSDPLSGDLDSRPPEISAGRAHLTSWASKMLEQPTALTPGGSYVGASGKSAPLVEAGPLLLGRVPWRNEELFGRRLKPVPRPPLLEELRERLGQPVLRVTGPLGCGKTRLVWQTLERRQAYRLWLKAPPERRPSPSLAQQIAQQILHPSSQQREDPQHPRFADPASRDELQKRLESWGSDNLETSDWSLVEWVTMAFDRLSPRLREPVYLVCDDVEQLHSGDLAFLAGLQSTPELGSRFRLILVGRGGGATAGPVDAPTVAVPPLNLEEMAQFADLLFSGLSLPESVRRRLLEATVGCPFALEEGMFELIRKKTVRRIYGSFFFGGEETEGYQPSLRLVCHVEAEALRMGGAMPLRLAALAGETVPPSELAAASSLSGHDAPADWETKTTAAGLTTPVDSPWGPAIRLACPAHGAALARAVPAESVPELRRLLGELLAARSQSGEAHWRSHRLLTGSPEAIEPLLEAVGSPFGARIPRHELLEALTGELELLRSRGGDPKIEFELLWRLLPLARRLGKLHKYTGELGRAVDLSSDDPRRVLALASIKAEMDQEAGRYKEAENTLKRALQAAKGADLRRQSLPLMQLGRLFLRQARYREARELFDSLRGTLARQGYGALAASCAFYLGNIASHENRLEDAVALLQESLEVRRGQGLKGPQGFSLSALGAVTLAIGNYPLALRYYEEARQLLEEHGKETDVSYTLMGAGRALTRLGDYTGASQPLRSALALRAGKDDVAGESIARLEVAKNYLHLGQPEAALKEARQAHFHLSLLSLGDPQADAESLLGRIRLRQRQLEEARQHLLSAAERHRKLGEIAAAAFDRCWLLDVAFAAENEKQIREQAAELKSLLAKLDHPDMGERLDLRLFRGLEWLSRHGHKVGDPLPYLERSFHEVMRKAGHLTPEQRHRFLFQIPDNRDIVELATRLGLEMEEPVPPA